MQLFNEEKKSFPFHSNHSDDCFSPGKSVRNLEAISMGKAIRKLRREKNISQGEAALSSNISQSYLSHVEKGNHCLSVHKLMSLSNGMDIPTQVIWDEFTIQMKKTSEDNDFDYKNPT